jgi:hypothetical protein
VSHRSLWNNDLWTQFRDYIDDLGGIYKYKWGDAPLHTIGISMLLSRQDIHSFGDIGYSHSPFIHQLPRGLMMPRLDPFTFGSIKCEYYNQWRCIKDIMNSSRAEQLELTRELQFSLKSSSSMVERGVAGHVEHYVGGSIPMVKGNMGVIFTFGHHSREDVLFESVMSFYEHYASLYPTPFVVFFDVLGEFDVLKIDRALRAVSPRPTVTFKPVELQPLSVGSSGYCSAVDPEVQAASQFLKTRAGAVLAEMGFGWFFRFGDDSRILRPVEYDIFERMEREQKR